jgi:hypothetical protein
MPYTVTELQRIFEWAQEEETADRKDELAATLWDWIEDNAPRTTRDQILTRCLGDIIDAYEDSLQ